MTTKSFQIGTMTVGTGKMTIKQDPVMYTPSTNIKLSEGVLIYGQHVDTVNTLLTKIIQQSMVNEQMLWVVIHTNDTLLPFFTTDKSIVFAPVNSQCPVEFTPYRVPVRFCDTITAAHMFDFAEYPAMMDIYSMCLEKTFRQYGNTPTRDEFITILQEMNTQAKDAPLRKALAQIIDRIQSPTFISIHRRSAFQLQFIKMLKTKVGGILHVYVPMHKSQTIAIMSAVVYDMKYALREARTNGLLRPTGIVFDDMDGLITSPPMHTAIHDNLFSWGRSTLVTRIGVNRSDQIPKNELFEDGLDSQSTSRVYQILLHARPSGTFDMLNRMIVGGIKESVIEGQASDLPYYVENVTVDPRIYKV